eukprot:1139851-Pelagomonas_calceolata.AAC.3
MDGHMLAFTCGTIAGACAGTSYCTRCGSQHHLGAHLWLFEYCAPAHPCVWDCMRYHPSVWDCTRIAQGITHASRIAENIYKVLSIAQGIIHGLQSAVDYAKSTTHQGSLRLTYSNEARTARWADASRVY